MPDQTLWGIKDGEERGTHNRMNVYMQGIRVNRGQNDHLGYDNPESTHSSSPCSLDVYVYDFTQSLEFYPQGSV